MKFKFAVPICILLTAAFTSLSFPQMSLSARLENYYDDNIYNNFDKISDFVHSASLDAGYNFESDNNNFQLYYMGNYTYFSENNFKSSNSNKIGIVNTSFLSEEDNPLNAGINFVKRNNRDELSLYDLSQLSAYANYRHFFNESDYFLTGYLFFYNDYKNFDSFTHYEHRGFAKYSSTFSTRTTLSIGSEVDFKIYKMKFNSPDIADYISQWKNNIQIAQSFTESTGLTGYFLYRKNFTTGNRYITYTDYVYYEEEIFNDAYSNDGIETGVSLTQLISNDVIAKGEFSYIRRDFSSLAVALADGSETNSLRADTYYAIGAELQINLPGLIDGLELSINYNYLHNNSNDYFYRYDNNLSSISLEWGF